MEKKTEKKKEPEKLFKSAQKWFKISKRTSLLINKNHVDSTFLPKEVDFQMDGVKKTVEQVAIGVALKTSVLLIGETGTGKTSLIRHLASKTKNAFVRVNHNGGTTIEDIVGRWLITPDANGQIKTEWVDGILIQAMKEGYWFLADEINAAPAEVNFVYHALTDDDGRVLIAEKGNEVVIPHPNFRFFGAMNPPAEYAGTKELNKALMSRFMVVQVDFPAPKTEQKILIQRTGVAPEVAERMVRFAGEIRVNHAKEQVRFVLSTRDLIMWARLFNVYKKYMLAAEMSILGKVTTDDIDSIKDLLTLNFKTLDAQVVTKGGEEEDEVEEDAKLKIPV